VVDVGKWIKEFLEPIGSELGFESVGGGVNVLSLSKDGRVIGMNGQPLPNGYLDEEWTDGLIPFPEFCLSVNPLPLAELRQNVAARLEVEQMLIDEMLGTPIVADKLGAAGSGGELAAIRSMRRGKGKIEAILRDDSHVKMATNFLSPTASLRTAVYSPDVIYAEAM
jgi:hypothetical protein